MDNWIEHPTEPRRLLLAWEPPLKEQDRARWAVGELVDGDDGIRFRYFSAQELPSHNQGRNAEQLRAAGYLGYPAFSVKCTAPITDGVLPAFLRRLPPAQRTDFARYLEHFRLRPNLKLTPFALLANTEAKSPSDGFSLIDPLDDLPAVCEFVFEVVGVRYQPDAPAVLEVGRQVSFFRENQNPRDANALRVDVGQTPIGYVNRLQAAGFGRWLSCRSVSGSICRVNGTKERPRAFVFVVVRPSAHSEAA
jgi:hypothetical protein